MPTDNVHVLGQVGAEESPPLPRTFSTQQTIDVARRAQRIAFLGASLDCVVLQDAVALATEAMESRKRLQHGDFNVAKFIDSRRDCDLHRWVSESDLICADGLGIVWGCRLLGLPIAERVTGIDLMMRVLDVCAQKGFRVYFLGAKQPVLEAAIQEVRRRYLKINIAGSRNGYFEPHEEASIVEEIRASGADCLFVGITSPIKERFLNRYRDALGATLQLGVGGSFDVIAGYVPRAPIWMQKCGLEWLFRLWREPRRLGPRYLRTNTQYLVILTFALAQNALAKCWRLGGR
jgi:N-acetylglucosaminyldiphosphoundecaprenol N-acetyl-beta-D-mannosaminyltransferase